MNVITSIKEETYEEEAISDAFSEMSYDGKTFAKNDVHVVVKHRNSFLSLSFTAAKKRIVRVDFDQDMLLDLQCYIENTYISSEKWREDNDYMRRFMHNKISNVLIEKLEETGVVVSLKDRVFCGIKPIVATIAHHVARKNRQCLNHEKIPRQVMFS